MNTLNSPTHFPKMKQTQSGLKIPDGRLEFRGIGRLPNERMKGHFAKMSPHMHCSPHHSERRFILSGCCGAYAVCPAYTADFLVGSALPGLGVLPQRGGHWACLMRTSLSTASIRFRRTFAPSKKHHFLTLPPYRRDSMTGVLVTPHGRFTVTEGVAKTTVILSHILDAP